MKQYYTANISKENIDLLYSIGYDEKISPTFADAFDYIANKGLLIMVVPVKYPDEIVVRGRINLDQQQCRYFINGDQGQDYICWTVAADAAIADACRKLLFEK